MHIDGQLFFRRQGRDRGPLRRTAEFRRIQRTMGMVFQQFSLFPHLTVRRNIMLAPIRTLALAEAEARARAERLLAKVGLEDKALEYPDNSPAARSSVSPSPGPWRWSPGSCSSMS